MTERAQGASSPNTAGSWDGFAAAYLSVDRRVLGLFRIYFGLVLLYDLGRRVPEAARLFSNEGVLSNHFLLFSPQASPQFSLLFACSSAAQVRVAFALIGLVYSLYCLGLCTRVVQVLAFLACTSLNARNLFFEDGGTCTTILLAAWTLFLPLGDRFSLDALLRAAQKPTLGSRVRDRATRRRPFVSLAVLAILLQASTIYYFNAIHKTGGSWRHGEAVHLVLWQHRVNTELGLWLAHHEPLWFSPVCTWLVMHLELIMPMLILFPVYRQFTRSAAFIAAVGLHTGIALLMTLGPFSYSMMALMLLCVPGEALDALDQKLPRAWFERVARMQSRVVARLANYVDRRDYRQAAASRLRSGLTWAREGVVLTLLVASAVQVAVDNPPRSGRRKIEQPELFRVLLMYPRMQQFWGMFSPDAPQGDGTLVIDALTVSGQHIDPFTGAAPDFEIARRGLTPYPAILADYLVAMSSEGNRRYDPELKRYLKSWHESAARSSADRIVSFSAWWASHSSPNRGEMVPGPVTRRLLLRARL